MTKRLLLVFTLLTTVISAFAYTVVGTVVDAVGEPLISASVRLLASGDSTVVKGVVSDVDGKFTIPNVNKGSYILETSYVGYDTKSKALKVSSNTDVGAITLSEGSIMLKETTVVGIKTPITVKEDTIEYNADSYRTAPNAVVEDLLKRLPGVEVDSQGKITANGQSVSKILVDGKEFFADDPTVASRNLPVDMVDKLQVVNRKSDLARLTGVDDGEEETVINLTVRKGMNNGWFGNAEAGYGTDDRYKASFNINRFWNGNQLTFLGGLNNINDLGFTDGGAGRFRRFGGDKGITKSQAFGVNFNIGKEEIIRFGGNVMWSRSDRDTEQRSDRQYILPDYTSWINTEKAARDIGNNLRADFRLQWKPDSLNTIDFRPRFSYNHSRSWSDQNSLTTDGTALNDSITKSINSQRSRGNSWEFSGTLIYNHKFRSRPGRAFSVFADYRFSDVREYATNYSWNRFFQLGDSLDIYDQFADNHTWTNSASARLSWTEPIGDVKKGNFLTFAYRLQYRWNDADKLTYENPDIDQFINSLFGNHEGWELSDSLSNRFRNNYMNQDIRVGFKHVQKVATIDVGVSFVPQMSKSTDLVIDARSIPTRWVWNFAPYLRYRWRPSNSHSLNLDYMGRSSQPTMAQLQPVADLSDPLNITVGNPDLRPSFTHQVRLRFQNFNAQAQRSIMTMFDGRVEQNSIISRTEFDQLTGGRTTTYTNVNGIWSLRGMNMISFPFKNKLWTFNNFLMLFYQNGIGYNNGSRNRSGSLMANESFGIAFRPENLELELRPRYGIQTVHNTVQTTANRTVHSFGGSFNATYITPIGITLNTDLNFTATRGYAQGYDENKWMWNAEIGYQFLRGKNATVAVRAYDLLRQNSNISRTINANYIEDMSVNSLGRYFMVSFAYKFNTFGSGSAPKTDGDFGAPGGPRGPGGPPPPGRGGRPPF